MNSIMKRQKLNQYIFIQNLFLILSLVRASRPFFSGYQYSFVDSIAENNATLLFTISDEEKSQTPHEQILLQCNNYRMDGKRCNNVKREIIDFHKQTTEDNTPRSIYVLKAKVNSFDIFDTILARDVKEPHDIFHLVEKQFPCQNFHDVRLYAEQMMFADIENIVPSFEGIYHKLQEITGIDDTLKHRLMEFEIEMEVNHTYLIHQNYERVQQGDILISDMYFNYTVIKRLLTSNGYNKDTNLFVTPYGKANGWLWGQLNEIYDIDIHLGDNYFSDVIQAFNYGVYGEWTTTHAMNEIENYFYDIPNCQECNEFSFLLRKFRHRNPFPLQSKESQLFLEQAIFNIPALLFAVLTFKDVIEREKIQRVLFQTREGCHLQRIFSFLFPHIETIRFHASRSIFEAPTDEFKAYLRSVYIPKKTIILDTFSTHFSIRNVFLEVFGEYPRIHYVMTDRDQRETFESRTQMIKWEYSFPIAVNVFEYFNYDAMGSLERVSVSERGGEFIFHRGPLTCYAKEAIEIYHATVDLFLRSHEPKRVHDLLTSIVKNSGRVVSQKLSHDTGSVASNIFVDILFPVLTNTYQHSIVPTQCNTPTSGTIPCLCDHYSMPHFCSMETNMKSHWCERNHAQTVAEFLSPYYEQFVRIVYVDRFLPSMCELSAAESSSSSSFDLLQEHGRSHQDSAISSLLSRYLGMHLASLHYISFCDFSEDFSLSIADIKSWASPLHASNHTKTVFLEIVQPTDSLWTLFLAVLYQTHDNFQDLNEFVYIVLLARDDDNYRRDTRDYYQRVGNDLGEKISFFFRHSAQFLGSKFATRVVCKDDGALCSVEFSRVV